MMSRMTIRLHRSPSTSNVRLIGQPERCSSMSATDPKDRLQNRIGYGRQQLVLDCKQSWRHGMALTLYYHPFSSYSWKALIPLFEAGTAFTARSVEDPDASADLKRLWPIGRFPVLVEETSGLVLPEVSIIIDYLDRHYPGPQPMLPVDEDLRLEVRLLDRFFDNYVHASLQKVVGDRLRPEDRRDAHGVDEARAMLDTSYAWLD